MATGSAVHRPQLRQDFISGRFYGHPAHGRDDPLVLLQGGRFHRGCQFLSGPGRAAIAQVMGRVPAVVHEDVVRSHAEQPSSEGTQG